MKRFFVILLIMFFLLPVYGVQDEIEWKKVAENSYINPDGIMGVEDIYGYSFLLKSYNKGQYESVNGKKINYTLSQYTIDCVKNKYKIGMIDSYGYDDNFINGDYNRYALFQPIVGGTAVSAVAKELCRP